MPRKSSSSKSAPQQQEEVVSSTTMVECEEVVSVPETPVVSESSHTEESSSANAAAVDDEDGGNNKSAQRTRKSVVEKIDDVLALLEDNAPVSKITKHLQSIRRALDGAQIKSSKKTRKPNQYNLFMSEKMEELKDVTDIPATEKFKMCIQKWNESKAAKADA